MVRKIAKWLIVLCFVGAALGAAGLAGIFWYFGRDLPELYERDDFAPPQMSRVYSAEGEVIAEYFTPGSKRTVVPLEEIPPHVRYAFMAAEDADFMRHEGIDYLGLIRAFYYAARYDTGIKGTSTITQQVVKNLMLTPEKAIERKVKEIILARQLEQHLTKEDILYLYLNTIYLGHGVNGVEEASRHYFGKSVRELSLPEAATLAGLTQAPESKTPFRYPDRAAKRRAFVLKQLWEKGFVEEAEYRAAAKVDPPLADRTRSQPYLWVAPHYTEHVRKILVDKYGADAVQGGGLRVYTALRVKTQEQAIEAARGGIAEYDERRKYYRPKRKLADADIADFVKAQKKKHGAKIETEAFRKAKNTKGGGATIEAFADEQRKKLGGKSLKPNKYYDAVVTSVDAGSETVRLNIAGTEARLLLEPKLRIFGGKQCTEETLAQTLMRGHVLRVQLVRGADGDGPATARFVPGPELALVAIDPMTRHVVAMVGGYDYEANEYDHATQAQRQTGSTFKPLVYAAALEKKIITPASIFLDSPAVFPLDGGKTWSPKNSDGTWRGPIRVREGLGASRNVIAVRILKELGIDGAIEFARKVGISSPLTENFTMVMGSSELRPLEITNAYATFASGGLVGEPVFITRVETTGRETEEFRSEQKRVLTQEVAYLISYLMTSVVHGYTDSKGTRRGGTASSVASLGHKVAGKTGTTNEAKDAWFIGFTPGLVTGVWVGFDDNHTLGPKEYGGRVAAPIWLRFMKSALDGQEPREFEPPANGLETARIDPASGKRVHEGGIEETFLQGTAPAEYAAPEAPTPSGGQDYLLNQFD